MAVFKASLFLTLFATLASCLTLPLDSRTPADMERRSAANGMVNIAYFANWDIYGRNYQPQQIPYQQLTHIMYCFANIQNDGTVALSDSYADLQKHYPTDSWNDQGNNVYGNIKQLWLLKKKNRNLKVLLSIGGWTYSPNFAAPMSTAAGRTQFVNTAITFVKDLGFDGVDIDWEYPADSTQAANFVALLQQLRSALDAYTAQYGGSRQQITVACPAGPQNYQHLDLKGMAQYVDFFNIMAYDYAGSFSNLTGHQANLYPSKSNPGATPFNTDQAVTYYLANGVPSSKLTMGMPIYGRAFDQTAGAGKTYNGVGSGSWENGVWDYKALPQAGATEYYDSEAGASYSYDSSAQTFISYDNAHSINLKNQYLLNKNLAGAMFWELSGDFNDSRSLTAITWNQLKSSRAMDTTQNTISYPGSQYANMVAGFPSG